MIDIAQRPAERGIAAEQILEAMQPLLAPPARSSFSRTERRPIERSAARTLTALPAQQPEPEEEPAVSIVVYDLPPGAQPVLVQHRPAAGSAAPSSEVEPAPPQPAHDHLFSYHPREGQSVAVGSWAPPRANQSANGVVSAQFCTTEQRETADLWRAELAAGRLPQTSDDPD
jgi:hypothetical protein